MIGGILKQARADAARIASAGGFQVDAVLKTPDGTHTVNVKGLGTGTWMAMDDLASGKVINTSSNSFNIPTQQLIDANYPYLKDGRPYLKDHKIIVSDGAGMAGTFTITEQHPNNTLGLIICILGRQKST